MKKHAPILLLFLYLMPTLGITVSWSKCNERNMKANNIVKCVCKPGNPNKKCCDNKKYTFKFKDSQQEAEIATSKLAYDFTALPVPIFEQSPGYVFSEATFTASNLPRPPNIHKAPIYLMNQVFRI